MKKGKESVWHEMLGNLLESFLSSRSQWSEDKDMILNEISLVIQNIIGFLKIIQNIIGFLKIMTTDITPINT
jgi:hypothetical protein